MGQGEFEGMPEPVVLRVATSDGQVLVMWGNALVYRFEVEDIGMRNLAIVALTDAGRRVDEVARVFDLTATYVSMLRGRRRAVPRSRLRPEGERSRAHRVLRQLRVRRGAPHVNLDTPIWPRSEVIAAPPSAPVVMGWKPTPRSA